MNKPAAALTLASVAVLALAGCSATPTSATEGDGTVQVVASTNVYGSIAAQIGGDRVDVESIITSATQDPHSYEATARDRLTLQKADLVIENGGGYDAFIDTLLEEAGDPHVITAVELADDYPGNEGHEESGEAEAEHDHEGEAEHEADHAGEAEADHADEAEGHEGHDHIEGFNEHVWYSVDAMDALAHEIAHELGEIDPDNAETFEANYDAFAEDLGTITAAADAIAAEHEGDGVAITEPVPLYLLESAGFVNVTPDAFSEAIEEGTDVSPAVLAETLDLFASGDVALLAYNAQTTGSETERVLDAAESASVPVVDFTETLPEGDDYVGWMTANLEAVADAIG